MGTPYEKLYLLLTFEADFTTLEDKRRDVVRRAVKRDVDAERHVHFGVLHSTARQRHPKRLRRGRNVAFCGYVQARGVQSLLVGHVHTDCIRQLRNQTQARTALKLHNVLVTEYHYDYEMKEKVMDMGDIRNHYGISIGERETHSALWIDLLVIRNTLKEDLKRMRYDSVKRQNSTNKMHNIVP